MYLRHSKNILFLMRSINDCRGIFSLECNFFFLILNIKLLYIYLNLGIFYIYLIPTLIICIGTFNNQVHKEVRSQIRIIISIF
jgi:hypothetical protein